MSKNIRKNEVTKILMWPVFIAFALFIGGLIFLCLAPDYNVYIVRSESMKPTINLADIIITVPVDNPFGTQLKPGTIVTYKHEKDLITHRVLSINGDTVAIKGDANEWPDPWPVAVSEVKGLYLFKVPLIGYVTSFVQTRRGWFLVVILPAALLLSLIVRDIVKEALRNEVEKPTKRGLGEPVQVNEISVGTNHEAEGGKEIKKILGLTIAAIMVIAMVGGVTWGLFQRH